MLTQPSALLTIVDDDADDRLLLQTLFWRQNNPLAIRAFAHGQVL